MEKIMRLPTPVYERMPQVWFLLGLLFIANGLYLGFYFQMTFLYIGFGFVCCAYGVGIHLMRLNHRQVPAAREARDLPSQWMSN